MRLIITDRRFGGGDWGRGSDISGVGRRRADGRYLFLFFFRLYFAALAGGGPCCCWVYVSFFYFSVFQSFCFSSFLGQGRAWTHLDCCIEDTGSLF